MKNLIFIILGSMFFICSGCPDSTDSIMYINNSDFDIVMDSKLTNSINDTLINYGQRDFTNLQILPAHDTLVIWMEDYSDYTDVVRDRYDMLFYFDLDIYSNEPWDKIVNEYLVLKRYDLTVDSMISRDWKIVYP